MKTEKLKLNNLQTIGRLNANEKKNILGGDFASDIAILEAISKLLPKPPEMWTPSPIPPYSNRKVTVTNTDATTF